MRRSGARAACHPEQPSPSLRCKAKAQQKAPCPNGSGSGRQAQSAARRPSLPASFCHDYSRCPPPAGTPIAIPRLPRRKRRSRSLSIKSLIVRCQPLLRGAANPGCPHGPFSPPKEMKAHRSIVGQVVNLRSIGDRPVAKPNVFSSGCAELSTVQPVFSRLLLPKGSLV